jgi:hypothetical protein
MMGQCIERSHNYFHILLNLFCTLIFPFYAVTSVIKKFIKWKYFTFVMYYGIFFFQNFCNSRRLLSVRYPFPHASLKRLPSTFSREPSAITLDREQSPNLIETACNSGRVPPLVDVSERLKVNCTSRRASCFSPTYSPTDSISYAVSPDLSYRVLQTHGSLDENAVRLQTTRVKYTYKKVSELLEPEQKVNMYGVISSITKVNISY